LDVTSADCLPHHTYAAFTHAALTTGYRTKNLYKSIFGLSRSCDI